MGHPIGGIGTGDEPRDGRILAADTPAGLLERTGARDVEGAFLRLVGTSEGVSA